MTRHAYMDATSDTPIESIQFDWQVVPFDESRKLIVSKNGEGLVFLIETGESTEKIRLVWPMPSADVQRLREFIR